MKKVMILTAMHKRYGIAELFCKTITRFMEASPYECNVMASATEKNHRIICKQYRVGSVIEENRTVSYKWNIGLSYALRFDWDYLLLIDDDDVLDVKAWDYYKPLIEANEDYFGLRSVYFYRPFSEEIMSFKYPFDKMIGPGRMVSRKAVEQCLPLWEDGLNSGLNQSMDERLLAKGYAPKFIDSPSPLVLDIKTKQNIWSYESYGGYGVPCDNNILPNFFTEDELKFLKSLDMYGNVPNQQSISNES